MHLTNAIYKFDDNNDKGLKMACHTMQFAGKRNTFQILQETGNNTQKDKNISNKHIMSEMKQLC
jgi:hypothetical protein